MKMENTIKTNKVVNIDSFLNSTIEKPSSRMGASSIAVKCERACWLSFHWAITKKIEPRIQRIFEVGKIYEDMMKSYLEKSLKIEIKYTGKEQIKVEIAPHFVCMPDGIILNGVPTAEKTIHTWECKSCNKDTYNKLVKDGLQLAKPEYYIQTQCEMYAASLFLKKKVDRAFFTALCKDNEEIYAERIDFDEETLNTYLAKAERIRTANTLPNAISEDPTFFLCKMCPYSTFCFLTHEIKNINCRTCTHSTPEENGTWSCALDKMYNWEIGVLNKEWQESGCDYHAFNPSLMFNYPHVAECSTETSVAFENPSTGEIVVNGIDGISSEEFLKSMISSKQKGEEVEWN